MKSTNNQQITHLEFSTGLSLRGLQKKKNKFQKHYLKIKN